MDKPVEFRRRGRGYDINDVNDFISRENIRFNKTKIVSLEIEKTELKDKISSLEAVISEKDVIIDGLKSAVDSANTKLDIANSIIEDLKNKPTPPQSVPVINTRTAYDDAIIEKANKYDSICNNIDEILAFAKDEADKIIAEAMEIRKQAAKRTPDRMKNDISSKSESVNLLIRVA